MHTRVLGPGRPGGQLPVEVVVRSGARDRHIDEVSLRLPWETPVSELAGRALGVVLSVRTEITLGGNRAASEVDDDLLHVSALPLHEAVLDAFAEEGYLCDSALVLEGHVRDTEQRLGIHQTFPLTGHAPDRAGPSNWRSPSRPTPSVPSSTSGVPRPTRVTGRTSPRPAASPPPVTRSATWTGVRRCAGRSRSWPCSTTADRQGLPGVPWRCPLLPFVRRCSTNARPGVTGFRPGYPTPARRSARATLPAQGRRMGTP